MNNSDRELLPISLGHVALQASLRLTEPDDLASTDIDSIKLSKYAPLPLGCWKLR